MWIKNRLCSQWVQQCYRTGTINQWSTFNSQIAKCDHGADPTGRTPQGEDQFIRHVQLNPRLWILLTWLRLPVSTFPVIYPLSVIMKAKSDLKEHLKTPCVSVSTQLKQTWGTSMDVEGSRIIYSFYYRSLSAQHWHQKSVFHSELQNTKPSWRSEEDELEASETLQPANPAGSD